MKKSLAIISLAFVACAASASTIGIQTGSYSGGSFATGSEYLNAVNAAVAGSAVTDLSSYDNLLNP